MENKEKKKLTPNEIISRLEEILANLEKKKKTFQGMKVEMIEAKQTK